jgi:predicted HTH domain antitoxin
MQTRQVEVLEELLDRLQGSRLGRLAAADQVKVALAIHLFLEGLISVGKAAELAGKPRIEFEWLVSQLALPVVRYDLEDDEQDLRGIAEAERRSRPG